MNYVSVCSGIEAATVAWHPLGWKPVLFAEIDKFPSRVLAHHYPEVPNVGDFTQIDGITADLLVGGTPCQDFSVAGLRAGMDGERGQLTVEFARLAGRLRPRWLVWENVPGVLSIDGGRAFGTFLGLLGQLGYGFAYRVLDAQYFGVPQRRRRVFVVGHLGDWRRAAAVLFERHSLSGHPAPSREAGQRIADSLTVGANQCSGVASDFVEDVAPTGGMGRQDYETETLIAGCLNSVGGHAVPGNSVQDADQGYLQVVHSLRADGLDASEDGTGRGTPIVPTLAGTLSASHGNIRAEDAWGDKYVPVAFSIAPGNCQTQDGQEDIFVNKVEIARTLDCTCADPSRKQGGTAIHSGMAVRRLTPRECERLQGFPDDYTKIDAKTADGPRYKALGNSMAVPVMRWIGERIQMVEEMAQNEFVRAVTWQCDEAIT